MKKSQSVFGSTLENEDIYVCVQLLAWLFYVFQATEQFWFLFYIKDEIFSVSVSVREREYTVRVFSL